MNAVTSPTIQLKIFDGDQLQSLNKVLEQIADTQEHHVWCSSHLPFRQAISEFPQGDKPTFSWSATDYQGETIGHMELHQNRHGWVIARVWVHRNHRRLGLARAMYMNVLEFASSFTSRVGAFCFESNEPSKRLLLSLGFTRVGSVPEQKLELFAASLTSIKKT